MAKGWFIGLPIAAEGAAQAEHAAPPPRCRRWTSSAPPCTTPFSTACLGVRRLVRIREHCG